jgi:hypothetical protein
VELDAVEPDKIVELCEQAIEEIFDRDLYKKLLQQQADEKKEFTAILKANFNNLLDE